ncbi:MAG: class I SAM-dependent methyltransferase [Patescibacteria group bacterium]
MQKSLYEDYRLQEETHWWFIGRYKIFSRLLKHKTIPQKNARALDIGCGTGYLTTLVAKISDSVYCVEMADEMIEILKRRIKNVHIIKGLWTDVAVNQTFKLVTLFDSLEHIEDDKEALKKIESVLEPGGLVIITVPAYQFLWSEHDDVNLHKRRYTKKLMRTTIEASTGLTILRLSYFNTIFFIPIALIRLTKKAFGVRTGESDIIAMPPILNNMMAWLFGLEGKLLPWLNFPFGTSLLCIAQKNPR